MLMVEPDRSEEPGAEIQPVSQRQQPYEEDGSAAQSELLENMCPQRRRGECASKSARNGGGCEGSHDDPDRGLMAGPDRPLRFADRGVSSADCGVALRECHAGSVAWPVGTSGRYVQRSGGSGL